MVNKSLILLLLVGSFLLSCDSDLNGEMKGNLPPHTSLTLNSINLPEGERLVSQIDISWWGDDPDGYVVAYEFYIGDLSTSSDEDWMLTQKTDSTFILPIPEGQLDADVRFNIRAIDNEGAKDENPASLVFPIRNSPPNIVFNSQELPPDTTYHIASFGFTSSDDDGEANLNRIEVALNDTTGDQSWITLSKDVSLITLQLYNTETTPKSKILIGRAVVDSGEDFLQVNVNAENTLYIRTFDNAEAVSEVKSYTWFVKEQASRILFLNDFYGENSQERANLHLSTLKNIGIESVDYLDISDGQVSGGTRVTLSSAFPHSSLIAPTTNLMLAQWDFIYWISDDMNRNIGYAKSIANEFLANGGKMFVNIPIEYLPETSSLFEFLPFQGIQEPTAESNRSPLFRVPRCAELRLNSDVTTSPEMGAVRFRQLIFPVYPIIPFAESTSLFDANFEILLRNPVEVVDYTGDEIISSTTPDNSILYFGFDLDDFTSGEGGSTNPCKNPDTNETLPPSDLDGLVKYMVIDLLGFEQ